MHTRYSPVRRSPTRYCYLSMPLDLHVLSLSLAFILSQDQTLRCYKLFLQYLSPRIPFLLLFGSSFLKKNDGVQFTFLVLVLPSSVVYVILFKELFFLFETWRKGNAFFLFPPNFSGSFFSFFRKPSGFAWASQPHRPYPEPLTLPL